MKNLNFKSKLNFLFFKADASLRARERTLAPLLLSIVILCLFSMGVWGQSLCEEPIVDSLTEYVVTSYPVTTGTTWVKVYFHIYHDDNCENGVPQNRPEQVIALLNQHYSEADISFFYEPCDNRIECSTFLLDSDDECDFFFQNAHADGIDIHLKGDAYYSIVTEGKGKASGVPGGEFIVGGAFYDSLFDVNIVFSNSVVLAHEMGHCLGLLHTYHGVCGSVLITCDNEVIVYNDAINNDYVDDTPQDPLIDWLSPHIDINCQYLGPGVCGQNCEAPCTPLTNNIMSHANLPCVDDFTDGQIARMYEFMDPNTVHPNPTVQYSISSSETWSAYKIVDDLVTVHNGAILTIDGALVEFTGPNAGIEVELGGSLVVQNGSHLTVDCDGIPWQGIVIHDGGNLTIDDSTIDNAVAAVSVPGTNTSGVISINNSQFINNLRAVDSYGGLGGNAFSLYISNCDFIDSDAVAYNWYGNSTNSSMLYLENSYLFNFSNCRFRNELSNAKIAIENFDSGLELSNCRFENFEIALDQSTTSLLAVTQLVQDCEFLNNRAAYSSMGSFHSIIENNQFLKDGSYVGPVPVVGTYFEGNHVMSVTEANLFNHVHEGAVYFNTGNHQGELVENLFKNAGAGGAFTALDGNHNLLVAQCNDFQDNLFDITLEGIIGQATIAPVQIDPTLGEKAATNKFSANCPNNNTRIATFDNTLLFDYHYYGNLGPRFDPTLCDDGANYNPNREETTTPPHCWPGEPVGPPSDDDPPPDNSGPASTAPCRTGNFNERVACIDWEMDVDVACIGRCSVATYDAVGGSVHTGSGTIILFPRIISGESWNSIHSDLEKFSPYLAPEVLVAILERQDFPTPPLFHLLQKHQPLNEVVLNAAENREDAFGSQQLEKLHEGALMGGLTPRQQLTIVLSQLKREFNGLMRDFLQDSLKDGERDEAIEFLKQRNWAEKHWNYVLVDLLWKEGRIQEATDIVPEWNFEDEDNAIIAGLYQLYARLSPDGSPLKVSDFGGEDVYLLSNLATKASPYAVYAKNWLRKIEGGALSVVDFWLPQRDRDNGRGKKEGASVSSGLNNEIKLYPNPLFDNALQISGLDNDASYVVRLLNIEGKEMLKMELNGSETLNIPKRVNNGLYLVEISSMDGERKTTIKLQIVR